MVGRQDEEALGTFERVVEGKLSSGWNRRINNAQAQCSGCLTYAAAVAASYQAKVSRMEGVEERKCRMLAPLPFMGNVRRRG